MENLYCTSISRLKIYEASPLSTISSSKGGVDAAIRADKALEDGKLEGTVAADRSSWRAALAAAMSAYHLLGRTFDPLRALDA